MPGLDATAENGLERGFLRLKHDGPAGEAQPFLAGDLCHGAFGGKISIQNA